MCFALPCCRSSFYHAKLGTSGGLSCLLVKFELEEATFFTAVAIDGEPDLVHLWRIFLLFSHCFVGNAAVGFELPEFSTLEGIIVLVVADAESKAERFLLIGVHLTPIPRIHIDDFGPVSGIERQKRGPLRTQPTLLIEAVLPPGRH